LKSTRQKGNEFQDKSWLYQKYWVDKLSIPKIAKLCGCCGYTIWMRLKKFDIPRRTNSTSQKGELHHLWGTTRSENIRKKISESNRKYTFLESIFHRIDLPEKAYWLGFLMADGCILTPHNANPNLTIRLAQKDKSHLEKFKRFLSATHPITQSGQYRKGKFYPSYQIVIVSQLLTKDLAKHGIVPRKTGKEHIPNIPEVYVRDFIRGYFDGDGCIYKAQHNTRHRADIGFNIASSSSKFLLQLQTILVQECQLNNIKLDKFNKHSCLNYRGNIQVPRIMNYLYKNATVFLDRKYHKFKTLEVKYA